MSEWDAETAEWYAQIYGDYPTNRLAVQALDLAADSAIVDVGCGTGSALCHAAAQVNDGALIGVDPVARMVELVRLQTASDPAFERIVFHQGTAEDLPIGDAAADVVFACDSFDHWTDQARGLSEVRRILRADGRLVVVKDGDLPGATKARKAFTDSLESAGFAIAREREIAGDDVTFPMWECFVPA